MSQRKCSDQPKRKALRPARTPVLTILNPNAAGIDVHADMHMVCVPAHSVEPGAGSAANGLPANVRRSGANSCDLAAIAPWMAAQALGRTRSPLGLFYRRIKSRLGGKGAVTATAHKLACLVYRMLKYGKEYVRQSIDEYEQRVRKQMERSLQRKAAALGYQLIPMTAMQPIGT